MYYGSGMVPDMRTLFWEITKFRYRIPLLLVYKVISYVR